MTRPQNLPPTHREAIRAIFLRRRIEYTMREAASLLRLGLGETLAWADSGQLQVEHRRKRKQLGGARHAMVKWNDLAAAAMLRWTIVQIHDALGNEADRVLPRLLRPVALKSIRLPEYQVRLIEALATHEGVSVEEYIFNALLRVETECDAGEIERLLPGFHEAMEFPSV